MAANNFMMIDLQSLKVSSQSTAKSISPSTKSNFNLNSKSNEFNRVFDKVSDNSTIYDDQDLQNDFPTNDPLTAAINTSSAHGKSDKTTQDAPQPKNNVKTSANDNVQDQPQQSENVDEIEESDEVPKSNTSNLSDIFASMLMDNSDQVTDFVDTDEVVEPQTNLMSILPQSQVADSKSQDMLNFLAGRTWKIGQNSQGQQADQMSYNQPQQSNQVANGENNLIGNDLKNLSSLNGYSNLQVLQQIGNNSQYQQRGFVEQNAIEESNIEIDTNLDNEIVEEVGNSAEDNENFSQLLNQNPTKTNTQPIKNNVEVKQDIKFDIKQTVQNEVEDQPIITKDNLQNQSKVQDQPLQNQPQQLNQNETKLDNQPTNNNFEVKQIVQNEVEDQPIIKTKDNSSQNQSKVQDQPLQIKPQQLNQNETKLDNQPTNNNFEVKQPVQNEIEEQPIISTKDNSQNQSKIQDQSQQLNQNETKLDNQPKNNLEVKQDIKTDIKQPVQNEIEEQPIITKDNLSQNQIQNQPLQNQPQQLNQNETLETQPKNNNLEVKQIVQNEVEEQPIILTKDNSQNQSKVQDQPLQNQPQQLNQNETLDTQPAKNNLEVKQDIQSDIKQPVQNEVVTNDKSVEVQTKPQNQIIQPDRQQVTNETTSNQEKLPLNDQNQQTTQINYQPQTQIKPQPVQVDNQIQSQPQQVQNQPQQQLNIVETPQVQATIIENQPEITKQQPLQNPLNNFISTENVDDMQVVEPSQQDQAPQQQSQNQQQNLNQNLQSQMQKTMTNNFESEEPVIQSQAPTENFASHLSAATNNLNQAINLPSDPIDQPQSVARQDFNITEQIVEHAKMIKTLDNTEMVIHLKPEHLGELTLRVSVTANGAVNASFHSDNAQVRAIIENTLVQLKNDLANQGLKVDNVQVSAHLSDSGMMNGRGQQAWEQNQRGNNSSRIGRIGRVDGSRLTAAEESEMISSGAVQENIVTADSVDYRV